MNKLASRKVAPLEECVAELTGFPKCLWDIQKDETPAEAIDTLLYIAYLRTSELKTPNDFREVLASVTTFIVSLPPRYKTMFVKAILEPLSRGESM